MNRLSPCKKELRAQEVPMTQYQHRSTSCEQEGGRVNLGFSTEGAPTSRGHCPAPAVTGLSPDPGRQLGVETMPLEPECVQEPERVTHPQQKQHLCTRLSGLLGEDPHGSLSTLCAALKSPRCPKVRATVPLPPASPEARDYTPCPVPGPSYPVTNFNNNVLFPRVF